MEDKRYKVTHIKVRVEDRWNNGWEIKYPASEDYNGGTIINGKWYQGYDVTVEPVIPKDFKLIDISVGRTNYGSPSLVTMLMQPLTPKAKSLNKKEVQKLLDELNGTETTGDDETDYPLDINMEEDDDFFED